MTRRKGGGVLWINLLRTLMNVSLMMESFCLFIVIVLWWVTCSWKWCVSLRKSKTGFSNPKESENGFCFSLLNRSIQDFIDHGASVNGTEESIFQSKFFGFLLRTLINFLSHIIKWRLEQLRIYSTRDIWKFFQNCTLLKKTCNFERIFKYSRILRSRPPLSPFLSDQLSKIYQKFPSQIIIHTSCKRPPVASDHDNFLS